MDGYSVVGNKRLKWIGKFYSVWGIICTTISINEPSGTNDEVRCQAVLEHQSLALRNDTLNYSFLFFANRNK